MKIFKVLSILLLSLFLSAFQEKKGIVVNFYPEEYELELDDTVIVSRHKVSAFMKMYGEPSKKVVGPDGITQTYLYEEYGMTMEARYGTVRAVSFTFNGTGDTSHVQTAFTGKLRFGSQKFNSETRQDDLLKIKDFFTCRSHGCMSTNLGEAVQVLAVFEKGGKKRLAYLTFIIKT